MRWNLFIKINVSVPAYTVGFCKLATNTPYCAWIRQPQGVSATLRFQCGGPKGQAELASGSEPDPGFQQVGRILDGCDDLEIDVVGAGHLRSPWDDVTLKFLEMDLCAR